jgi:hypothetical protein
MSIGAYGNQLECSVHLSVAAGRVLLQHNAKWRHWLHQIKVCNLSCETLLTKGVNGPQVMSPVTIDLVAAQLAFCASTALPNDFPSWLSVRPSVYFSFL